MLKGIGGCRGIVIGKVFFYDVEEITVISRPIKKSEVKQENDRLKAAYEAVKKEIRESEEKTAQEIGKKRAKIFEAYRMIIDDPIFRKDVVDIIEKDLVNAEAAVSEVMHKIAKVFDKFADEYMRERGKEIVDIGRKIIKELMGENHVKLSKSEDTDIVVFSNNLMPSDLLYLVREYKIKGFVAAMGGKTSHTAIFARAVGIPCVLGVRNAMENVDQGDTVIIDGEDGVVIVKPDADTTKNYQTEIKRLEQKKTELKKLSDVQSVTKDGFEIKLLGNIEIESEIEAVLQNGGLGIGLYRTEYLFLNKKKMPSEDEQFECYRSIVKKMMPFSVIIRTLDLGGDKLSDLYSSVALVGEKNPFLGLRSIRFSLKYPQFFIPQLRAIYRASAEGKVKIMFPMISGVGEIIEIKKIIEKVKEDLKSEGIPFYPDVQLGAMIEVPSAALTCDLIAKEVDFLSIGTNDLIQYTLAVDRINQNVADLYEPLHISVLRLIDSIVRAAAKEGKDVSMCGEMAGDQQFTKILIGLGLKELSMSPALIPEIKKNVINTVQADAKKEILEILELSDRKRLKEMASIDKVSGRF